MTQPNREEREVLNTLKQQVFESEIVINPAHKGSATVIWSYSDLPQRPIGNSTTLSSNIVAFCEVTYHMRLPNPPALVRDNLPVLHASDCLPSESALCGGTQLDVIAGEAMSGATTTVTAADIIAKHCH